MTTKGSFMLGGILAGVPVLTAALWLASGREVLTKAERAVTVSVPDRLFGDTNDAVRFVRGPVFGYYVGLDLVIATLVVWLAIVGTCWLLGRRRAHQKEIV